jgi:hypothetical protein
MPDSGRRGIQRSGIKEEANGRGTAAESEYHADLSPPIKKARTAQTMQAFISGRRSPIEQKTYPAVASSGFALPSFFGSG